MRASGKRKPIAALMFHIVHDKWLDGRAWSTRLSGLTKPTLSSRIADLIARAIVAEDGERAPGAHGLVHDLLRDLGRNEIQLSTMR